MKHKIKGYKSPTQTEKKMIKKKCIKCKKKPSRKKRKLCYSCTRERYVAKDPVRASYKDLKSNAKRRGKKFTITLAYFRKFCYKTDYIQGKGRTSESYTVDRIREELGYVPGNLQVKKNGDNVRKYLNYCWQTKEAKVITDKRTNDFLF